MTKLQVDASIVQLALVAAIGAIGVVSALQGHWDVVSLVVAGGLGALNLPTRQPPPAP
jgi:hypothetical protein